jgi:hypothetical protein
VSVTLPTDYFKVSLIFFLILKRGKTKFSQLLKSYLGQDGSVD